MLKIKTKLNFILILFLFSTIGSAQKMYVKQKNGTQTTYLLSEIRKMTFSSGSITLTKIDGNNEAYLTGDIRYFSFSDLTGVQETEKQNTKIVLYPVPVVDILHVCLPEASNENYVIEIINIEGKVVSKSNVNSEVFQMNVSFLPKGLYLCRIYYGINVDAIKFMKN